MPFDGAGNFSRSYNWTDDRNNGIYILASRMDGECDNFAAGLNVVFFRNGLVPMSGNLSMGSNYLIGLGAGNIGALAVRFADDVNSGMFLNGVNKPTIVSNGVSRLEANTTGVLVSGTLNSSGVLTENTVPVMTTAGGTFTGTVTAPLVVGTGAESFRAANATPIIALYNAAQTTRFGYFTHTGAAGAMVSVNGENGGYIWYNNAFGIVFSISNAGNAVIGGALTGTSGTFSSDLHTQGSLYVRSLTPIVQFYNAALSDRFGYIQHGGTGGNLTVVNEEAANILFTTNGATPLALTINGAAVTGTLSATGLITSGAAAAAQFQAGYSAGAGASFVQGYNTGTAAFIPLNLYGSTVTVGAGAAVPTVGVFTSAGLAVTGTLSATGTISSTAQGTAFTLDPSANDARIDFKVGGARTALIGHDVNSLTIYADAGKTIVFSIDGTTKATLSAATFALVPNTTVAGTLGVTQLITATAGVIAVGGSGLKFSGTSTVAGLGFDTGAGGSVVQITSKATGVAINKHVGKITTHNANLAAGATVAFTVTNTCVAATDIVVLATQTFGLNYRVWVASVGAGTFGIAITNLSAGGLTDPIDINFAVIKGVIA